MDFREAGQRGGLATTPAKVAAAIANGKKPVRDGSRPRGRPVTSFVTRKALEDEAARLAKMKAASPGRLRVAQAYGPATLEPLMPDFYFYVVHVAESLYTLLGPGCVAVTRTSTADSDVATGVWAARAMLQGARALAAPSPR